MAHDTKPRIINGMNRALKRLAENLFDYDSSESAGQVLVFRMLELFVAVFAIKFCWEWALYIQHLGSVIYPVGIARHVNISFIYRHHLAFVNAGLISLLCFGSLTRRGPRWAYFAAFLLLHLQYVARFSLGKVEHGTNMVGMSLFGLALALLFFEDESIRRRFAVGFIYFFTGLGYTLAAACKLAGTGLSWPDGHHLTMWMQERSVDVLSILGSFAWNPFQALILDYPGIGTILLTFGLMSELCGVLIWWRKTRYFVMPALIGMHLGVMFTMNISFMAFVYELLILGVPWPILVDKYRAYRSLKTVGA